ncbi:hypothetical protein SAMN05216315_10850 [Nitrosospira sp. Nsp18]|nr:hypothetical protein SAMN05216315_10850 [Nitrosospira sp. Nsp18]
MPLDSKIVRSNHLCPDRAIGAFQLSILAGLPSGLNTSVIPYSSAPLPNFPAQAYYLVDYFRFCRAFNYLLQRSHNTSGNIAKSHLFAFR